MPNPHLDKADIVALIASMDSRSTIFEGAERDDSSDCSMTLGPSPIPAQLITSEEHSGMPSIVSRLAFVVGVGFLLTLGWPESSGAATLTVTDFGDNGSPGQLRTLINAAAASDTILIPAGTITLGGPANEDANVGGDLDILKNLNIQGAGAGVTIIDGGLSDGVFDILAPHSLTLSGVTIRNGRNSAQAGGGGIRNFGTFTLSNAIVSNNEAARTTAGDRNNGGGIRNLGTMSLTNVVITGNLARGDGGGVYNELGAVMTLSNVTVSANTADISGGGIYNLGTVTLTRVTVRANTADISGGGIFTSGAVPSAATATLTNVTVSGNHVTGSGGGIFNSATATLTNVTVSGNTADFSGGGIRNFPGPATLKNVILSGNTAGAGGGANCSGTIVSLGHNLDSGATCGPTGPGDLSNTDPLLGPLQDNGGFTLTHALLPGSPAIDAGTNVGCPATDQRGLARPQGAACDIGAYESSAATPPGPVLDVLVNGVAFTPGSAFKLDLIIANSGGAMNEDFYFGALLPSSVGGCPNNDPVAFFTGSVSNLILACLSGSPSNIVPFARNIAIPPAVPPTTIANFLDFVWSNGFPAGSYTFFAALADTGTLNIRALGVATVTFTP